MLSSRASSGRKPWVAAEPMISSRPAASSARNAPTRSPPTSWKQARGAGPAARARTPPAAAAALSPVAASEAGASAQAVRRWSKNASISRTNVGLASWLASTGVKPIVTGAGDPTRRSSAAQRLEQRQVGVERRLAEPVAAVRPAPVIEHVRQVAVQREDEVHRGRVTGRSPTAPARGGRRRGTWRPTAPS